MLVADILANVVHGSLSAQHLSSRALRILTGLPSQPTRLALMSDATSQPGAAFAYEERLKIAEPPLLPRNIVAVAGSAGASGALLKATEDFDLLDIDQTAFIVQLHQALGQQGPQRAGRVPIRLYW